MKLRLFSALLLAGLLTAAAAFARQPVDELYDKAEYRIAMRDSVKLYTPLPRCICWHASLKAWESKWC